MMLVPLFMRFIIKLKLTATVRYMKLKIRRSMGIFKDA